MAISDSSALIAILDAAADAGARALRDARKHKSRSHRLETFRAAADLIPVHLLRVGARQPFDPNFAVTKTESRPGRSALMVAHCAGMVDLVALPVWVGTLIANSGLDPQQAGGLVTLFLEGAVARHARQNHGLRQPRLCSHGNRGGGGSELLPHWIRGVAQ